MAEGFEDQDSILRDWAKIRNKKSVVEALNKYEKQEEIRKKRFFFGKWPPVPLLCSYHIFDVICDLLNSRMATRNLFVS